MRINWCSLRRKKLQRMAFDCTGLSIAITLSTTKNAQHCQQLQDDSMFKMKKKTFVRMWAKRAVGPSPPKLFFDGIFLLSFLQNLRVKYYKEGDWISEMKLAKGWKLVYAYTLKVLSREEIFPIVQLTIQHNERRSIFFRRKQSF